MNQSKHNGLKIAFWNIQSQVHKLYYIEELLRENNIDVLVILESWLRADIEDRFIKIKNFTLHRQDRAELNVSFFFFVCFISFFVFRIADLPHSPGVVYYHLLLRRETRIPGVAPFSFRIGNWDIFVHRGQKCYTPTAFGKLGTTPGGRFMKHASS